MDRTLSLAFALLLMTGTIASAQFPPQPPPTSCPSLFQGTQQEREACQPDVRKLCKAELAANECDVFGILNCLRRNQRVISCACHQVLERNGQLAPSGCR